jgi:hypothetical protein
MDHIPGAAGPTQGGDFDPRQAAALLDQATRQARRQFTPLTPLLFTFRAVALLVVFGGFWLSVRGQHPYTGLHRGWAVDVAVVLVGGMLETCGSPGKGVYLPGSSRTGSQARPAGQRRPGRYTQC